MSDTQLLEWNRRGLIPGPDESEDQYVARVKYCLNLKHELELDPSFVEHKTEEVTARPFEVSRILYDIEPNWLPIVFGNKHLAPWHGGCAWIFQMSENGPLGAFVQLRRAFLRSANFLGFYRRDELIAHEVTHACRMAFQEPAFEEIFAYRCARNGFTRYVGPIIESSLESVIFMLALAIVLFVEGVSIYYGIDLGNSMILGLFALPLAMIVYGFIRLWNKWRQFGRCQKKLLQILNDTPKVNAVLYRLKDSEIRTFAKSSIEDIQKYVKANSKSSLRWRVIDLAYFT